MAIRICVCGQSFRNKYSNINHVSRSNNQSSPIRLQFRILKNIFACWLEFSQYNLTKSEECYLILKGNVLYALFAYLWDVVSPNGWTRKHMRSFVPEPATKGGGNQLYPIYMVGCNYSPMPLIPASGTILLIYCSTFVCSNVKWAVWNRVIQLTKPIEVATPAPVGNSAQNYGAPNITAFKRIRCIYIELFLLAEYHCR